MIRDRCKHQVNIIKSAMLDMPSEVDPRADDVAGVRLDRYDASESTHCPRKYDRREPTVAAEIEDPRTEADTTQLNILPRRRNRLWNTAKTYWKFVEPSDKMIFGTAEVDEILLTNIARVYGIEEIVEALNDIADIYEFSVSITIILSGCERLIEMLRPLQRTRQP